jgi:hypothetical protein
MPSDILKTWQRVVWAIAAEFCFQPDKIWNMYLDEFLFWAEGAGFLFASREN